jgi:hypothetical protein
MLNKLVDLVKTVFGFTVLLNLIFITETYGHGVLVVYYIISLIDDINSTIGFIIGSFYTLTVVYTIYIKLKKRKFNID